MAKNRYRHGRPGLDPPTPTQESVTIGAGAVFSCIDKQSFQAVLTGDSGSLSATVVFEVSNDGAHFVTAGEISLSVGNWVSAADDDTNGFYDSKPQNWAYIRSNVTAISGDGAKVNTMMS